MDLCDILVLIKTESQIGGESAGWEIWRREEWEVTRKRLRISVPHFYNSDLIKAYSKTLIGRCMNSKKQDMKALLTNLQRYGNLRIVWWDRTWDLVNSNLIFKVMKTLKRFFSCSHFTLTIGWYLWLDGNQDKVKVSRQKSPFGLT